MKILISPVAKSDPIASYYDGPMLHLMRYLRPEKIILIFTNDVREIEKNLQWVDRIKKLINKKWNYYPKIVKRWLETDNPFIMEEVSDVLVNEIEKAVKTEGVNEVILNTSSGTPAMQQVMSNESIGSNITAYIVADPFRGKSGKKIPIDDKNYNLEDQIENNYDEMYYSEIQSKSDEEVIKEGLDEYIRYRLSPLIYLRLKRRVEQIKPLLKKFDYNIIATFTELPTDVKILVDHLKERKAFHLKEAEKFANEFENINPNLKLYPIKPSSKFTERYNEAKTLIEYFLLIDLLLKENEINEFLLRLSPFTINLFTEYINRLFAKDKDIDNPGKILINKKKKLLINLKEIYKQVPALFDSFSEDIKNRYYRIKANKGEFKVNFNMLYAINILEYYYNVGFIQEEDFKLFNNLYELNRVYRNSVAHRLLVVDRSEVESGDKGINLEDIMKSLRKFMQKEMYPFLTNDYIEIYEKANQEILIRLNEQLSSNKNF